MHPGNKFLSQVAGHSLSGEALYRQELIFLFFPVILAGVRITLSKFLSTRQSKFTTAIKYHLKYEQTQSSEPTALLHLVSVWRISLQCKSGLDNLKDFFFLHFSVGTSGHHIMS